MLNKLIKIILLFVLAIGFSFSNVSEADAAAKVMWGKTELKIGQVGKVVILGDVTLYKLDEKRNLVPVRTLKKGEEYRVYPGENVGDRKTAYYHVGSNHYVKTMDKLNYETPSQAKWNQLNGQGATTSNNTVNKPTTTINNGNGTVNTKPNEIVNTVEKITNGAELARYLGKNYAVLQTNLIKVDFDFVVYENDSKSVKYDYKIELGMDSTKFERAMNEHLRSIKYANTAKADVELARKQLNDFLEKMAKDVIEKMPNKKIFGQDIYVSYTYPNLKMDKHTIEKYSWTNYEPINMEEIWPGDEPEDYWSVMYGVNYDPSSAKVIKYSQDETARRNFASEYVTLDYDDFRISEFSWKPYLDGSHFSKN